jgi:hypothetical protein
LSFVLKEGGDQKVSCFYSTKLDAVLGRRTTVTTFNKEDIEKRYLEMKQEKQILFLYMYDQIIKQKYASSSFSPL